MNDLIKRARKLTNRLTTRMDINPRHTVEIRLLIKELTDAIAQQEVGQAFPPSTWECPICKKLMVMKDLNWCGKNLQCKNCESFSYYSDWVMIECEPEDAPAMLSPAVYRFAVQMQKKLDANSHKTGWDKDTNAALMKRLHQEFIELSVAVGLRDNEGITSESADVANFAMMLADNTGTMGRYTRPSNIKRLSDGEIINICADYLNITDECAKILGTRIMDECRLPPEGNKDEPG